MLARTFNRITKAVQNLTFPEGIRKVTAPPLRVSRAGGVFVIEGLKIVSEAEGVTAGKFSAKRVAEMRDMGDGRWALKFASGVRRANGVESAVVSDLEIDAGKLEIG